MKAGTSTYYDVTDEAVIQSRPSVVYDAVVHEMDGKTTWWMPDRSASPRGRGSFGQVGGLLDVTVHGKWPIRFTTETIEVREDEMIRVGYVEGALRGEGEWTFEPLAESTIVSYRWRTRPSGPLRRLFAPLVPVEKTHSDAMHAGFERLNAFLQEEAQPE